MMLMCGTGCWEPSIPLLLGIQEEWRLCFLLYLLGKTIAQAYFEFII